MANVVKRTTLIVRDVEASRRWYEQVLGLSLWMETDFTLSGEGLAAGSEGDVTRLVIMRGADPAIGMIGLLQWVDPPLPAPDRIPDRVGYGNPIFVVASDDVAGLHRRAVAAGTRVHCPPREWSTRGQNGRIKHFLGTSLFDPDGHFFECNELLRETD